MSNDLIAWAIAIGLGAVVIVVGLRRDLSEVTRSNLPRFGEDSEPAATVELSGVERGPPSTKQTLWLASFNLLIGLLNGARALLESDDRLLHAAAAAAFVLGAAVLALRASRHPSDVAAS